jgi:hypothetical protein
MPQGSRSFPLAVGHGIGGGAGISTRASIYSEPPEGYRLILD